GLGFICVAFVVPAVLSAFAEAPPPIQQGDDDVTGWHRLVGLLQYLESDYPPAARSHAELELAEHRALIAEGLSTLSQLGPRARPFEGRLQSLSARIDRAEDPEGVSRDCADLIEELASTAGLSRSPRRPPDLTKATELYATGCAACHAADGSGRVEIADQLQPKPASFLDPDPLDSSSPYKVFNVVTFGIDGT